MAGCKTSSVSRGTRLLPRPIRGSREAPGLDAGAGERDGRGDEAPRVWAPGGRSQRGATPGTEEVAPASPASAVEGPPGSRRRARGRGFRRRLREAGARRGLQVPACPAALTRPLLPLKGSGSRSRRVAAAFALPPLQGGREQPAPSPALLSSFFGSTKGRSSCNPPGSGIPFRARARVPRLSHPAAPMPRYG